MQITEENFIEQMKKRNEKALEYLIDNYAWVLKTVLKKHLFKLMDRYHECMNDCLLAIWENVHYYNPEKASFKNWIGGIAKYKSIDYIRKYIGDLENKNIEDVTISMDDNSLKSILEKEVKEEIEDLLCCLSAEDQMIFKKRYLMEEGVSEISEDTGLSKSVLYNRISRGKKKIWNEIESKGGLLK
ncbi:MAG: sigma-70 family RNA polymerase sigma factor [Clostridia bacterium]|nr:sigma-70 family RNA polymerase sigma factor [Clostridia bacterium]